jgi:hypothetical protein
VPPQAPSHWPHAQPGCGQTTPLASHFTTFFSHSYSCFFSMLMQRARPHFNEQQLSQGNFTAGMQIGLASTFQQCFLTFSMEHLGVQVPSL